MPPPTLNSEEPVIGFGDGARQHLRGVGDVSAPRPRVSGQGAGDGPLSTGLVRVDEDFLAVGAQPPFPGLGLENAPCSGRSLRVRRSAMTVWSTRSGRNCSMRSSARLGRLSVGACAIPRDGSSPAACSAPMHSDRRITYP